MTRECVSSTVWACPGSLRIVRIEHWQPWAVVRQADELRALGRDLRDDMRADRESRGARGGEVGDEARPVAGHLEARHGTEQRLREDLSGECVRPGAVRRRFEL